MLSLSLGVCLRLGRVSMSVADEGSGSGVKARAVEVCQCPPGYDGTSCEVSQKT